jgi:hypothetical protein
MGLVAFSGGRRFGCAFGVVACCADARSHVVQYRLVPIRMFLKFFFIRIVLALYNDYTHERLKNAYVELAELAGWKRTVQRETPSLNTFGLAFHAVYLEQ